MTSSSGRTSTWYCFSKPPNEFTSATPGTERSWGFTTQSWSVRSSVRSPVGASTLYWKISPRPARDRAHLRRPQARRDLLPRFLEPLLDELAGEVDVDVVLEDHRDLREPELRERADLLDVGQAGHGHLDGQA